LDEKARAGTTETKSNAAAAIAKKDAPVPDSNDLTDHSDDVKTPLTAGIREEDESPEEDDTDSEQ
jgi:hypothetical protein